MAGRYDFPIEQGITLSKTVTWKDESGNPVNLTGMEVEGSIRSRDGLAIAQLECIISNPAAGEILIGLDHETTGALDFSTAVYDLDVWQGGVPIKRLLRGVVTLCTDVENVDV